MTQRVQADKPKAESRSDLGGGWVHEYPFQVSASAVMVGVVSEKAVQSAREEAKVVARLLGLVRGRATGHGDISIEAVDVVTTTVVYRRDGKTFHLVVHDMTDFKPSTEEV